MIVYEIFSDFSKVSVVAYTVARATEDFLDPAGTFLTDPRFASLPAFHHPEPRNKFTLDSSGIGVLAPSNFVRRGILSRKVWLGIPTCITGSRGYRLARCHVRQGVFLPLHSQRQSPLLLHNVASRAQGHVATELLSARTRIESSVKTLLCMLSALPFCPITQCPDY